MKKILFATLFIISFFSSCSQPNKMAFYKQDANVSHYPNAWQVLLLLPEEYFPKASIKHFVHPPFMSNYQKSNPGFINLNAFKKKHPRHQLSQLSLWYSASFFLNHKIIHYMIMEFPNERQAKNYVSHLQSKERHKLNRILRYKTILFSFTLRDFENKLLDKNAYPKINDWINQSIKRVMENL